jgi:outer membrane protein OmpA-like peptidoglycan-associated protein
VDGETGKPIGAKIIYERLPDGTELGIAQSNPETGEYEIKLPAGHLYGIRAEAKDHVSESQNLNLRNITSDMVIQNKDFNLQPIRVARIDENATITLNNIFFDFDKAILKPESFPELDRLVALMKERPAMQVEIDGHTCDIGEEQYNMGLSERRAKAVQKYIIGKGIEAARVAVQFFGETKPAVENTNRETRRKNRRVEFKIVKL